MRTKLTVLFLVSFLFLGLSINPAGDHKKTSQSGAAHPFQAKRQRHLPSNHPSLDYQNFISDLKQVADKLTAMRAGMVVEYQTDESTAAVSRLNAISGGTLRIHWSEDRDVPIFIKGSRLQSSGLEKIGALDEAAVEQQAQAFFSENAALLHLADPQNAFTLTRVEQDAYGLTHARFQQQYRGLEVWARDVVLHFNTDGTVESFNGRYLPTPLMLSLEGFTISESKARQTAQDALATAPDEVSSRQLIYVDDAEVPHLAWLVTSRLGLGENWYHFIDGRSGITLKRHNHIMQDGPATGTGVDLFNQTRNLNVYQIGSDYLMIDASKPMFNAGGSSFPDEGKGVIYTYDVRNGEGDKLYYVVSANPNSWNNQQAVSAAANGALVFDYYKQVHNRNAIDNKNTTMNLAVNFKSNYNNAFWNGQFMVFGNGDGNDFSDLAGALDVTAHEMSHGVVEHTANLVYENQPGALNESFADVFGVLFEFWVEGSSGDWLIGEDVTTPGTAGDALRDMENPGSNRVAFGGQQPTKMSEFRQLPNTEQGDNGGVHINSGIPNRAFYLFATAVGLGNAERVYYQALSNYLTRNSNFIDCRLAVIKAAEDIFGVGSAQAVAAGQAFDGVEIFSGDGTPPPPVNPPVEGEEYLAVIDAASGLLYRMQLSNQQFTQLSAAPLFSRPTVADNGSSILYVDNTGNLHVVGSDGSGDRQLSNSGGFNNVSLSPNGRYLAATSQFIESRMYIADLQSSTPTFQPIQLYTPTYTQGENAGNILYPDRIDWASDNQILMYDAFNISVDANGDTTGYWDINLLRPTDGLIARLFPPQPPGISIGNAVFASNTDNVIAFDYVDENGQVLVLAVDLNTGNEGMVTNNFSSLGSPTFSRNDNRVYYHYIDSNGASIWYVDLLSDGLTGNGNDQRIVNGGVFPVDFTIGTRPTSVESPTTNIPEHFALAQNYPNPFNPETTIRYELPWQAQVKLTIVDRIGRLVATLEERSQPAGAYQVQWDGKNAAGRQVASGIYFYRLETTGLGGTTNALTRKLTLLR